MPTNRGIAAKINRYAAREGIAAKYIALMVGILCHKKHNISINFYNFVSWILIFLFINTFIISERI